MGQQAVPWDNEHLGPLVIAEVGVNHNGSVDTALRLIDAAASAGADAVKFQTFHTDSAVSRSAPAAPYQEQSTGQSNQAALIEELELPAAAWEDLCANARDRGLHFMSTAFDSESLGLIDSLDPPAHKVPSGELTNHDFLHRVAECGRPVIMSTGMANEAEIADALFSLGDRVPIALLHCVTAYPAPTEDLNLLSLPFLRKRFGLPVGWSDHSTGDVAGVAAVALGAVIIERHITLDRHMVGPDHAASLEPEAFASHVAMLRQAWIARGVEEKVPRPSELVNLHAARRSWHAARDLEPGTRIKRADVIALRPLAGIAASEDLVGQEVGRFIAAGEAIHADQLIEGGRSGEVLR